MADVHTRTDDVATAVDAAIAKLIGVRHRGHESFVQIPIFYPSGAGATVCVSSHQSGFRVSDYGFAFREAEMVGAEHMFGRRARIVADAFGIEVGPRTLQADASEAQLAGTISDVAVASAQVAHQIVLRAVGRGESEIAAHIFQRLTEIYGANRVEAGGKLYGASTREWEVSALLRLESQLFVFDAVANHHASVYSSAAKFRDLALLTNAPVTTAVVHSKIAMGSLYNIIAQAGNVIEETATKDDFRLIVAA